LGNHGEQLTRNSLSQTEAKAEEETGSERCKQDNRCRHAPNGLGGSQEAFEFVES
jgi:hypothetical protein